jgi:hypothetical protein
MCEDFKNQIEKALEKIRGYYISGSPVVSDCDIFLGSQFIAGNVSVQSGHLMHLRQLAIETARPLILVPPIGGWYASTSYSFATTRLKGRCLDKSIDKSELKKVAFFAITAENLLYGHLRAKGVRFTGSPLDRHISSVVRISGAGLNFSAMNSERLVKQLFG